MKHSKIFLQIYVDSQRSCQDESKVLARSLSEATVGKGKSITGIGSSVGCSEQLSTSSGQLYYDMQSTINDIYHGRLLVECRLTGTLYNYTTMSCAKQI